jgi:hypothetical protein
MGNQRQPYPQEHTHFPCPAKHLKITLHGYMGVSYRSLVLLEESCQSQYDYQQLHLFVGDFSE